MTANCLFASTCTILSAGNNIGLLTNTKHLNCSHSAKKCDADTGADGVTEGQKKSTKFKTATSAWVMVSDPVTGQPGM